MTALVSRQGGFLSHKEVVRCWLFSLVRGNCIQSRQITIDELVHINMKPAACLGNAGAILVSPGIHEQEWLCSIKNI